MPSSETSIARLPLCEIKPRSPGTKSLEARSSSAWRVVQTHAVRPDQNCSRGANALDDGLLPAAALRGALPEPGRDRDDRPSARGERAFHGLFERARGDREHDQLGRLGQLLEGAVRLLPENGSARAVDQEDRASVRSEQGSARDPLSPLRRVVRRPDHGHRARLEERAEVATSAGTHRASSSHAAAMRVRCIPEIERPSSVVRGQEDGARPPRRARRLVGHVRRSSGAGSRPLSRRRPRARPARSSSPRASATCARPASV